MVWGFGVEGFRGSGLCRLPRFGGCRVSGVGGFRGLGLGVV